MSSIAKQRIIGLCIIAAFPLFGGGQAVLGTELNGLGLALCLANSLAVIVAGFLMRSIMVQTTPRTANIYLFARLIEGVLLGLSVLGVHGNLGGLTITEDNLYQLAMVALGLGSLPMCYWLVSSNFVAKWLGALGFVGYLCLAAAMCAAALGFELTSMVLLLPGSVFEVTFGLILILRRATTKAQFGSPHTS